MKRFGVIIVSLFFTCSLVFAQEQKQKDPDEQIIVNKKYDENGNLIQFDSTYVHQWSSDSTFQFSFPDDPLSEGNGFPDLSKFFDDFLNDSSGGNFVLPHHFNFPPFADDDFFDNFGFLSDSLSLNGHQYRLDSLLNYFRNRGNSPDGFGYPDMDALRKRFEKFQEHSFREQEFKSPEQKKEWEKLMEKQRKEKEAFQKKWEGKGKVR